jgi:hypothetical protein
MGIYATLSLIPSLAAMFRSLHGLPNALARPLGRASSKVAVEVIDRLLVVLFLVEILHTVRISIRSHRAFSRRGSIRYERSMLVITLDAANLTSAANWANEGEAKLRASMLKLGLLGHTVGMMPPAMRTFVPVINPANGCTERRQPARLLLVGPLA